MFIYSFILFYLAYLCPLCIYCWFSFGFIWWHTHTYTRRYVYIYIYIHAHSSSPKASFQGGVVLDALEHDFAQRQRMNPVWVWTRNTHYSNGLHPHPAHPHVRQSNRICWTNQCIDHIAGFYCHNCMWFNVHFCTPNCWTSWTNWTASSRIDLFLWTWECLGRIFGCILKTEQPTIPWLSFCPSKLHYNGISSIHHFLHKPMHPYLSIYLSVCLSIYLSIYLYIYIYGCSCPEYIQYTQRERERCIYICTCMQFSVM